MYFIYLPDRDSYFAGFAREGDFRSCLFDECQAEAYVFKGIVEAFDCMYFMPHDEPIALLYVPA